MDRRGLIVAITSGPTREPVDEVRYVSNVSTGTLGASIASAFLAAGHRVSFLSCIGSKRPPAHPGLEVIEFESAESLLAAIERTLAGQPHAALIHAAAVADYAPVRTAGKISSSEPELVLRMKPTPKIADRIRARFPSLPLVMFKLEAGIPRDELWARARRTMQRAGADAIVANLVAEVTPTSHRADLLRADGTTEALADRAAITSALVREVERLAADRAMPGAKR